MTPHLRKATVQDSAEIMTIFESAILFLHEQGSPQWQDGFGPTEQTVRQDIEKDECYVLIVDNKIVGTATLVPGIDPVYSAIVEGNWRKPTQFSDYLSIHRVAVSLEYRGQKLAQQLLHQLIEEATKMGSKDIRIDTYPENLPMQAAILSAGFDYQGMVHFPIPEGQRRAYQFLIE